MNLATLYPKYRKAVHGAAIVVLPWALVVVNSDQPGITAAEWVALGFAVFGVGGGVAATHNTPPS